MLKGIEVDQAKVKGHVENSLMLVTALAPKIGYDKACEDCAYGARGAYELAGSGAEAGVSDGRGV